MAHATVEALDVRMKAWDIGLAQPRWRRHYNAAAFGPDGLLYAAGAFRHSGQLDVAECYDPIADRWRTLPPMGVPLLFGSGAWLF